MGRVYWQTDLVEFTPYSDGRLGFMLGFIIVMTKVSFGIIIMPKGYTV